MSQFNLDAGKRKIILFDGVCSLCDGFVNFVQQRDVNNVFCFSRLQSPTGKTLLRKYNLPTKLKTIFYIEEDTDLVFSRSSAVFRILSYLPTPWSFFYGLTCIPPVIRDFGYETVARYRYIIFGKKDPNGACPYNPNLRKKCIDWGEECEIEDEETDEYAAKEV